MLKSKNLRIDYYHVIDLKSMKDEVGNEHIDEQFLNLSDFFRRLAYMDVTERNSKTNSGEIIRFQIIKNKEHFKIKNSDGSKYCYWELEILKERSSSVPGVATKSGEYNPINVEDGDLLSEDISALYDSKTCVMAVLRKQEGLSPSGIAKVLTKMMPNSEIELRPLISKQALEQFTSDMIYRSIQVSMINNQSLSDKPSLLGILDDSNELEAPTINVKFSIGKSGKREQSMRYTAVFNKITHLLSNPNVTLLKLSAKQSKTEKAKLYDLINEREHDLIKLEFSKQNPITHSRAFDAIEQCYFKKLNKFKM